MSDIAITLGCLFLSIGLLAVLINLFVLPNGRLPTREEEETTPPYEMLAKYRAYIRRGTVSAICYTLISVIIGNIPSVSFITSLPVVGALVAWMVVIGVWMERASMKRRIAGGTYGMTPDELREHMRRL